MEEQDMNGGPVVPNKRHSQLSEGRVSANSFQGSQKGSRRSSNRSSYADLEPSDLNNTRSPGLEGKNEVDIPLMEADPLTQKGRSPYGSKLDTRLEMTPDGNYEVVPGTPGSLDENNEIEFEHNKCTRAIEVVQIMVHGFFSKYGPIMKKVFVAILVIIFLVYLAFAIHTSVHGALVLIILTALVVTYLFFSQIWKYFGHRIYAHTCAPVSRVMEQKWWKYCRWGLYGLLGVGVIIFLIVDVGSDLKRLTSAGGMLTFILIGFITSTNPSKVNWRPIVWGIGLQFLLGVLILRWSAGYHFFRFVGDQVKVFLDYTDEGSKFVFGEEGYLMHRMAFKIFPIVIYFSAVISIFYYWGLMQFIVCKIAWLMQFTMGTTAIESLNAATNIFLGMSLESYLPKYSGCDPETLGFDDASWALLPSICHAKSNIDPAKQRAESCVILRPFLPKLTKSELHAVMSGGFATVAGSYIALLVEVGASPEHLLSAAIMSAPAALAMGKLSYPETELSCTKTEADVKMDKTPARNVVEAASNGAIAAIKVVASVAANLIAIIGLIAFFNATLSYLGARVGFPQLSFQLVCSYVFWPLAAVMGVELEDAGKVASLLGTKVFVDEFISFRDLGIMVKNGEIADRTIVIATYACCGFGSIAAVGVYIGALVSVAPERRGDISEVALRAVVNGNVAGFMTACIAGVLYTGGDTLGFTAGNATISNSTLLPFL